jgi:hypothetical protein
MYLLFKGGLIGVLLAVLGIGGIAWRGMIAMDAAADPRQRALLRGIVAAFVGQCVASLAMPRITYPEGHVFVALAALAVVVLAPENQESASSATITRPIDSPASTLRNAAGAASRP